MDLNNIEHIEKYDPEEELLFNSFIMDVKKASKFLDVSTKTIYKLVAQDEIPYKKVGGKIRFLLSELISWLKERR
jgi:excisionase family DNA binding protein